MIIVRFRFTGKPLITQVLPAHIAERTAAEAVRQGADYHVMEGCWDASLRRHVLPPAMVPPSNGDDLLS